MRDRPSVTLNGDIVSQSVLMFPLPLAPARPLSNNHVRSLHHTHPLCLARYISSFLIEIVLRKE